MEVQDFRALEIQLSCPSGAQGIEIGHKMNMSNIGMTKSSIEFLELDNKGSVLELGHGNCGHLDLILDESTDINYYGLEISDTMWKEAQKMNTNGRASFSLYDGKNIPYPNNYFNRIFTVNTIYFWSNPKELMEELKRVLAPDGLIVVTFADKSFMKQLPFVGDKFRLFDQTDVLRLAVEADLRIVDSRNESEVIESKAGSTVLRKFTMVKMK